MSHGAAIVNEAGATFEDRGLWLGYQPPDWINEHGSFDNRGTYRKTDAGGSIVFVTFLNAGAVEVQAGTIELRAGCGALAMGQHTAIVGRGPGATTVDAYG